MIASATLEASKPTCPDGATAKLLTDNRDRYIAQSKATKDGVVPSIEQVDALLLAMFSEGLK
jgi:hypothetical protein